MAKVWIANETYKEINSNSIITGSNKVGDIDQVAILSGSGAKGITINQAEVYHFAGNSTDFTFKNVKGVMEVYSKDGVTLLAKFAVTPGAEGENLKFNDGSFTAKMAADGGNNVVLHGKAGSTGSQILVSDVPTPAILDTTVVTIDPDGKSHEAGSGGDIPTPGPDGKTFTLTTGRDTFTGTDNGDIFNAPLVGTGGDKATLTIGDTLDGGLGKDVLNAEFGTGAVTSLSTINVKGIEEINITAGGSFTANINHWAGVENVNIISSGANKVELTSHAKEVSVLGGGIVTITDTGTGTGANLKSVSIDGASIPSGATANITINGAGVTDVSLANVTTGTAGSGLVVNNATAGHTLNLTLNNLVDAAQDVSLTDATAGSVNITTKGLASVIGTGTFTTATALNINADEALTIGALATAALKTITITGDSKVTLTAFTAASLETIDASGMTSGGVEITPALAAGVTFKGGAGDDTITVSASTKAHTMGAGNDTVTFTGAFTGTVDAGEGTGDVAAFTASAHYNAAAPKLTNFEILRLNAAADASFNASLMSGLKSVEIGGAKDTTVTGLAADTTVTLTTDNKSSGSGITLSQKTNTSDDSLTLILKNASAGVGIEVGVDGTGDGVATTGIEKLIIDSSNALVSTKQNTLWIDEDTTGLKNIKIQGDSNLVLNNREADVNVDATGYAKNLDLTFVASTVTTNITGGDGNDKFTTSMIGDKLILDGGVGENTLVLTSTALVLGDTAFQTIHNIDKLAWGASGATVSGGDVGITLGGNFVLAGIEQVDMYLSGSGTAAQTFETNTNYTGKVNLDLTLTAAVTGATSITTGAGADTIKLTADSIAAGAIIINSGAGADKIEVSAALQKAALTIDAGAGNDTIVAYVGSARSAASGAVVITGGTGKDSITIGKDVSNGVVAADAAYVTINIAAGENTISTSDSITGYVVSASAGGGTKGMNLNFVGTNTVATGTVGTLAITSGKVDFTGTSMSVLSLDEKIKYLDDSMGSTLNNKAVFFIEGGNAYVFNNDDVNGSSVVELIGVSGAAKLDVAGGTAADNTIIIG